MAALDRTILRVAIYELLHRSDVPPGAAISEAVEAAKELSADESRRFVNGVLGKIAREPRREQAGRALTTRSASARWFVVSGAFGGSASARPPSGPS